jgi:flagellar basal-body rod protein FlgG
MSSLQIAATGMLAQQLNVEVISNNLANMNTTGFKRQRAEFQDLLYQNLLRVGSTSSDTSTIVPTGIQLGVGVKLSSIYRITEQGNLKQTGNDYDVAVQGGGYFQITMPDGTTSYTRSGSFQLSPTGEIVTAEGYTVLPGITIPPNAIAVTINGSGEVLAKIAGTVTPSNVGQFQLVQFPNNAGLEAIGDNLFLETPASGASVSGTPGSPGFGSILQGYVETSNVNAVEEITNLITAQRAYEMLARVISTSDEMAQTVAQLS